MFKRVKYALSILKPSISWLGENGNGLETILALVLEELGERELFIDLKRESLFGVTPRNS